MRRLTAFIPAALREALTWPAPFDSAYMEAGYRLELAQRFLQHRRAVAMLALLLWVGFGGWDYYHRAHSPALFDDNVLRQVQICRLIGAFALIATVVASWRPLFEDDIKATRWLMLAVTVPSLAELGMMAIIPAPLNFEFMFVGLLLTLIFMFSLLHISAKISMLLGAGIFVAMLLQEWLLHSQQQYFLAAAFYFVSFWFVGAATNVRLEKSARERFLTVSTLDKANAELEERRQEAVRERLRAESERSRAENEAQKQTTQRAELEAFMTSNLQQRELLIKGLNEATQERERFVRAAYHDTMQPLASIAAFSLAAKQQLEQGQAGDGMHYLDQIALAAKDTENMFRGIYDFFTVGTQAVEVSDTPICSILDEIRQRFAPMADKKRLEFRVRVSRIAGLQVQSDPRLLKRIIENLVSNAIKYTEYGGILLGVVALPRSVRIDVWDTGIGIPEGCKAKIFDEFFQVSNPGRDRAKGLGLGLSIVRLLVERLPEHRISFSSTPGAGSRFSIDIPRASEDLHQEALPDIATSAKFNGAYMIIVDDDVRLLESLKALMTSLGAIVRIASSVAEAQSLLGFEAQWST